VARRADLSERARARDPMMAKEVNRPLKRSLGMSAAMRSQLGKAQVSANREGGGSRAIAKWAPN